MLQRATDLLRVDQHPLAAHAHQRRLQPHQRLELGARDRLVAERDLPFETHDLIERQAAPTLHRRRAYLCP
jgi:hypothetical protein